MTGGELEFSSAGIFLRDRVWHGGKLARPPSTLILVYRSETEPRPSQFYSEVTSREQTLNNKALLVLWPPENDSDQSLLEQQMQVPCTVNYVHPPSER